MRSICVIPARMASSRFPGKPLKPLLGMSLIEHVYHRCRLYDGFERVIVATCDRAIADVVTAAGGEAVMTVETHERCTDRVDEAVDALALGLGEDDVVMMVQGDEILVTPQMLDDVVEAFRRSGSAVVNLLSRIHRVEDHDDVNVVKAVTAPDGRILFLSRAPIPSRSRAGDGVPMLQQTGVIAFRAPFLRRFGTLAQTPLERIESIDMLRLVEHGLPIVAAITDVETIGVDTEADRLRAEQRLADDPLILRYLSP